MLWYNYRQPSAESNILDIVLPLLKKATIFVKSAHCNGFINMETRVIEPTDWSVPVLHSQRKRGQQFANAAQINYKRWPSRADCRAYSYIGQLESRLPYLTNVFLGSRLANWILTRGSRYKKIRRAAHLAAAQLYNSQSFEQVDRDPMALVQSTHLLPS